MTEDALLQGFLLDAAAAEFASELTDTTPVAVSPRLLRQMNSMLNDPNSWAKRQHRSIWSRLARTAAVILLVLSLSLGALMAVSPTVRAAVINWVRELYENSTVYHVMPSHAAEKLPRYKLTWLPDGFSEPDVYEDDTMYTALYENPDTGDFFVFDYCLLTEETQTDLFTTQAPEHLLVNGMDADFYVAPDDSDSSNLLWVDTATGVFCSINSTLSKEDILRIAESITLADNSPASLPIYELTWLPDGFGEPDVYEDDTSYSALYENPSTGDFLVFEYCLLTDEHLVEYLTTQPPEPLLVNGFDADFYAAADDSDCSNLLWVDSEAGVLCFLDSTLSKEDILRVAEGISLADNLPAPLPRYELTWLPDGFGEPDVYKSETTYSALYENTGTGDIIGFDYYLLNEEIQTELYTTQQPEHLLVRGADADFYLACDDSDFSNLLWVETETGVLCSINSTLSKEDILRIAESISLSDKVK